MIDFQGAERKRLEEPASEIGLEPLCAMVCKFCNMLGLIDLQTEHAPLHILLTQFCNR